MGFFSKKREKKSFHNNADNIARHYLQTHLDISEQIKTPLLAEERAVLLGKKILSLSAIDLDCLQKTLANYEIQIVSGKELTFILERIAVYIGDMYLSLKKNINEETSTYLSVTTIHSVAKEIMSRPRIESLTKENIITTIANSADEYVEREEVESIISLHCGKCHNLCVNNENYIDFKIQLQTISLSSHAYFDMYVLPVFYEHHKQANQQEETP